jgi:hypothetical protein
LSKKKDSIYAITAGILLTILILGIIVELVSPRNFSLYMIAGSVFAIFLWLNAWRVTRKKKKNSIETLTTLDGTEKQK